MISLIEHFTIDVENFRIAYRINEFSGNDFMSNTHMVYKV